MKIFDDLVEGVEIDIGRHDAQKLWLMLAAGAFFFLLWLSLVHGGGGGLIDHRVFSDYLGSVPYTSLVYADQGCSTCGSPP